MRPAPVSRDPKCLHKINRNKSMWAGALAGAPLELTEDLLTTFNIALVVRGSVAETGAAGAALAARRYAAARARGIFRCARSGPHRGLDPGCVASLHACLVLVHVA